MQTGIQLSLFGVLLGLLSYRLRDYVKPETRDRLGKMFFHYLWGCFASGLNGAVLAVKGTLGVAAGAAFNPQAIQAPNTDMALYIFGVAWVVNALDWFNRNPLPTEIPNGNVSNSNSPNA